MCYLKTALTHNTQSTYLQERNAEFPLFKWTNWPPDQFTVVEEKGTKFCVGQEDRDTLVFVFLTDVIQQSKFSYAFPGAICSQP